MGRVRLTWTIGGVGLVLCGVMGMFQYSVFGLASAIAVAMDIVFAGAVLLFAIGLSQEASVVARRPLGTTALAVVALWPLVMRVAQPFLPTMDAATFDAGLEAYRAAESVLTTVFVVNLLVSFAAGSIAAVQIARAKVVPGPWRWAPLWALVLSAAAVVLPQLLFAVAGATGAQIMAEVAILLGAVGFLARTLGLGILALVLAARTRADSVNVYPST